MKNNPKFGYIQLYYNSRPQIYITILSDEMFIWYSERWFKFSDEFTV